MAEWIWILALFIALTIAYFAGFAAGSWKTDRAPSEHAWINVRKYSIDAQKETSLASLQAAHEEQMAMIERGAYDSLDTEDEREGQ